MSELTPETDALRDSFGGDCCGEAHKALLLSAKFERELAGVLAAWKAYKKRGMNPAPNEYQNLASVLNALAAAKEPT